MTLIPEPDKARTEKDFRLASLTNIDATIPNKC